jgi:hypothetical protein
VEERKEKRKMHVSVYSVEKHAAFFTLDMPKKKKDSMLFWDISFLAASIAPML